MEQGEDVGDTEVQLMTRQNKGTLQKHVSPEERTAWKDMHAQPDGQGVWIDPKGRVTLPLSISHQVIMEAHGLTHVGKKKHRGG